MNSTSEVYLLEKNKSNWKQSKHLSLTNNLQKIQGTEKHLEWNHGHASVEIPTMETLQDKQPGFFNKKLE